MLTSAKKSYEQAGFKTCLLTFFHPGVEVFYASPALDLISTANLSFQKGFSALAEALPGSLVSQTQTENDLHIQSITLNQASLTTTRRTLLRELSIGRVHALVQDAQGAWWLYGQERGLRLRFKSDSEAGVSIALSGLEKEPARQVVGSLIPGFLNFLN